MVHSLLPPLIGRKGRTLVGYEAEIRSIVFRKRGDKIRMCPVVFLFTPMRMAHLLQDLRSRSSRSEEKALRL